MIGRMNSGETPAGQGRRLPAVRFGSALTALVVVLAFAGCAAMKGNGGVLQGDAPAERPLVTASDQTDGQKRAQLRLELAVDYFQRGQTTVALDEIKKALSADPNYAPAYNLRGLVYMRLDDPALAEDSFRRAIAIEPQNGDVLHNYGWLLCQKQRYADAQVQFDAALAAPRYGDSAKTLMTEGLCQMRGGQKAEAEASLLKAYELDAGNPVIGYNLAVMLIERGDLSRAQFYIRRVNNSASANAESLWLGIKIEHRLGNREAEAQLASQLMRRFPDAREALAYERGSFNE